MRTTILMLVATIAACATTMTDTNVLQDREWTLAWMTSYPTMPAGVAVPTIRFGSDGRVSAKTPCNSAGAEYTASGEQLMINSMFMTKRACANPEGNTVEAAYAGAIEKARRFRIVNGELELLDDGGSVLARFVYRR